MLLSFFGFLFFDTNNGWRWLMLVVAAYGFLILVGLFFLSPESARFYVVSGNNEEAKKVLNNLIRINNGKNERSLPDYQLNSNVSIKRGSLMEALKSKLRNTLVSMWFIWFSAALAFFGSSLNFGNNIDINLNLFYLGAAQIPAILIALVCVNYIGRKKTAIVGWIGCCFSFGLIIFFLEDDVMKLLLNLLASNFSSICFNALYLWTAELFPTEVRSVSNGTCQAFSRFGAAFAPLLIEYFPDLSAVAVQISFVSFCTIAAIMSFFIEETGSKPLSETFKWY